ncbi:cell envelope integrity protein TolA [Propionivibrio sp.]|uniref:cell envelope integrity protein TolA n=1 Tax=Propionivibrio sp. TaxID=2212460 RepID=UPI00272EA39D|nr:cell envelope integrity protein TolA [Propionivibrio sp.]
MNSQQPPQYDEPTNKTALALSAAVHALLIAALFFGVQWKNEQPGGTPVDVYFGNPAATLPPPRPVPEPQPEPKPEPIPEQKPFPIPEPKVVEPPQIDPQIAIKDKERREKEEKAKLEKERLEKEEAEKLKKQKLEEEQKQKEEAIRKEKEEKERARKEEEEKKKREQQEKEARRAAELAKELERDLKHAQQQRSSAAVRSYDSAIDAELKGLRGSPSGSPTGSSSGAKGSAGKNAYIGKIRDKIRGNTALPPGIKGNPEAVFKVTQLPSGQIIDVKLSKSSGNKALDDAIERAIRKSDPLPLPDQPGLFERVLELKYKPFNE